MNQLATFYKGKTVLVTGHTGFKGVWLSAWLTHLGAKVVGYSLDPPSTPNNFEACHLSKRLEHLYADIRDEDTLTKVMNEHHPEIVFHLAAQSLVRPSFVDPVGTFDVNVMGTVKVLEAARLSDSVQAVISITSDKCYRNKNWVWGYRETDELGGYDPYSASKACAELVVTCYQDQRFQTAASNARMIPIASVRAGNVIGGGDWATNRVIPDIIRAIVAQENVVIRSPNATRPWQHVLEPLSGYLWLGRKILEDPEAYASSWNLGPRDEDIWTVEQLAEAILGRWNTGMTKLIIDEDKTGAESKLLRLDCAKSQEHLGWRANWTVPETLDAIVEWYRKYYEAPGMDMYETVLEQIDKYSESARANGNAWAQPSDD